MRKVLIVASVISFIEWFNKENIDYLRIDKNCEVHLACNFEYFDDTDEVRTREYIEKLKKVGVVLHNIQFERSPLHIKNIKAYIELKGIIDREMFDLIHCHTPTISVITRIASIRARKNGSSVMYTCHGFHFHNSSSKLNWIVYYPIEKLMSLLCDYIVTINKEDYNRAKTFYTKNVRYIPGVGVDIKKFQNVRVDKALHRRQIGVPEDSIMLISVGELIERKNHEVIIKALGKIKRSDIYYVLCGKGPLNQYLRNLARDLGIEKNVVFLGFRKDIPQLCKVSDMSAFPSKIEGLGLAGIEVMAAGVPLISSNVHGILDYVIDGKTGFSCSPNDINGFANAIEKLANDKLLREKMKPNCILATRPFDLNNALRTMWDIYDEIL